MGRKRYPEEFKVESVKPVMETGYSTYDVAERLGTTTNSLYSWIRRYGPDAGDVRKVSLESTMSGRSCRRHMVSQEA
jgi:transposase